MVSEENAEQYSGLVRKEHTVSEVYAKYTHGYWREGWTVPRVS